MTILKNFWIYAFCDDRYESGVKIGVASKRKDRYQFAQGYTPGNIAYLGSWKFLTDRKSIEAIEKKLISSFPKLENPFGGTEWIDVPTNNIVEKISKLLSHPVENDFTGNILKNDQIHTNVPKIKRKGRAVLWVFQENETFRLKVTCLCDWTTPLENHRTYSRNGFRPVAAFLNCEEVSQAANDRLYELHSKVINRFSNANPMNHNWLDEDTSLTEVLSYIPSLDTQLEAIPVENFQPQRKPKFVARTYNKSIDLNDPEFSSLENEPIFL